MTAAARFKQADLTRAIKGAKAAGMKVGSFEINPNGKIVILSEAMSVPNDVNPWDSLVGKA